MGRRGPKPVSAEDIYCFAQVFYWDFRHLVEGGSRFGVDRKRPELLVADVNRRTSHLGNRDRARLEQAADEEIRAGRLKLPDRQDWFKREEESLLALMRAGGLFSSMQEAQKEIKIPGEPDVMEKLMRSKTTEQIRRICRDAFTYIPFEAEPGVFRKVRAPNWPISGGSTLPLYLSRHAQEFIAAKEEPRFPLSGRPTSQLKQLWFLSRALAGAVHGITARTAINLVGSLRPEQLFNESRAAKPVRKRTR